MHQLTTSIGFRKMLPKLLILHVAGMVCWRNLIFLICSVAPYCTILLKPLNIQTKTIVRYFQANNESASTNIHNYEFFKGLNPVGVHLTFLNNHTKNSLQGSDLAIVFLDRPINIHNYRRRMYKCIILRRPKHQLPLPKCGDFA